MIFKTNLESLQKGIAKVLRFGKFDRHTAEDSSPYGIDAGALKGMTAIYAETSTSSENVIIGYIGLKRIAEEEELRLYSKNGEIFLKKNGEIILNKGDDFAIKFNELQKALTGLAAKVNIELLKVAASPPTSVPPIPYLHLPLKIDISSSKVLKVKL